MKHREVETSFSPPEVVTQCYLGLLLTAFVLYTGAGGYETIGDARYRLFLALCGGYVALMALLQAERLLIGRLKPTAPWVWWKRASLTQKLVTVYLALTLVSAVLSPHRETWLGMTRREGALSLTIYGLCFLLVSVYGRAKPWQLYAFGAAMTAFCVISLLQFADLNPLGLYPGDLRWKNADAHYGGAYFGTIGNADAASALVGLAVPLFGVGLWKGRSRARWLLAVPLILSVLVLVRCRVSAGFVALIGGLVVTVPVLLMEKRRRRLAWCVGIGLCAIAVAVLYVWQPPYGTLREVHQLLHGQVEDSFGSGRVYIWKQVLQRVPEHLLFGTGPDTMAAAEIEGFSYYDAAYDLYIQIQLDLAHNEYLNILYHQGLPALLAYLAALGVTAVGWLKKGRTSAALAVCGSGMIWYGIQVFFGFSLYLTAPLFWAVWALAERENGEIRKERTT